MLIGKLGNISADDAIALHKKRMEDIQNEITDKSLVPTGILFFYPSAFLHVLEASSHTITGVIQSAAKDMKEGILQLALIPVISHDIPNHLFKTWSCDILKDVPQKPPAPHETTVVQQVSELLDQIIKLAVHMRDIPLVQLETAIQSLAQTGSDILPRENKINDLLREPSILSAEGYVEKYINIKRITMSEELVWPAPDKLLV